MTLKLFAAAGAVVAGLLVAVAPASATQINGSLDLTGSLKITGSWPSPSGLSFVNNKFQVPLGDPGLGDLSFITDGSIGNIKSISLSSFAPTTDFYDITVGGVTLQFDLLSIDAVSLGSAPSGYSLTLTGAGVFDMIGYDQTPVQFSLTTQCLKTRNGCAATARLSFSATSVAAPVPEPVTLSLFGAGLAGISAMRRKKQSS